MTSISFTEFNPFNHGTSTKLFKDVDGATFKNISKILLNGWGLTGVDSIEEVYEGEEKDSNNHKIRKGSNTYLFKSSHIDESVTQDLVNRCLVYCEENSIPVSHIVPTLTNETYYQDGSIYCLYDFIQGSHFNGSQEEISSVATQFAALHSTLRDIPYLEEIKSVKGQVLRHDRDRFKEISTKVRTANDGSEFHRYAISLIEELEAASRVIFDSPLDTLPLQVVHLDLHPHNMIFDPNTSELLAFLDFDPMCYSQRIRDVGFALHRIARTYGLDTEGQRDTGVDIRDRARLFLDSYNHKNPLTDEEIKMLPAMIEEEALRRIIIILGNRYLSGDETFNFDLEKQVTILREGRLFNL